MAVSAGYRPLPGSERPQIPGSILIGPVDETERVTVTLLLRRKPGSPDLPDLQHWQDTPPDKRRFLSADEFYERHGAAENDVTAVTEYLSNQGLQVLDRHAGRRRIVAEGTAAEINAAFRITLNRYRVPERVPPRPPRGRDGRPIGDHGHIGEQVHRGFEGPVHLPSNLIGVVTAVIGLDNRRLGFPAGVGYRRPPRGELFVPGDYCIALQFPDNHGRWPDDWHLRRCGSGSGLLSCRYSILHSKPARRRCASIAQPRRHPAAGQYKQSSECDQLLDRAL
jgi:hypothetical protein